MTTVTSFDNVEDMFAHIDSQREAADSRVEGWQEKLTYGDYFIYYERSIGVVIYGFIETLEDDEDKELYAEPHMKHYRPTRCYSRMCPEGEYGDVHVSSVDMIVSKDTFEKARQQNWPSDLTDVVGLVNFQ